MMQFNHEVLQRLRQAQRIIFFTGSGVSAESGIPTFRNSHNAFWVDFDTSTFATEFGFCANPAKVWQWYNERRKELTRLQPNPAHRTIAQWQAKKADAYVITQNIDGYHQRAGSDKVIELHGSILKNKCIVCAQPYTEAIAENSVRPPRCKACDSTVRPDVVWFDEALSLETYLEAERLCCAAEVLMCIGCSLEVQPAAGLPLKALNSGAYVIQINPNPTSLNAVAHCSLEGKAGEVLPLLWQAVSRADA